LDSIASSVAPRIAVITGDESILPTIEDTLTSNFHTTLLDSGRGVLPILDELSVEAIVMDLDTAHATTQEVNELVRGLRQHDPDLVLVGLTRSTSKAVRRTFQAAGIQHCFVAPVDFTEVQATLSAALEQRRIEIQSRQLREDALSRFSFCDLIGGSEAMRLVYDSIARVAKGSTTVLIRGESGTGKELVARAIVASGDRQDKPFISVNCAALPDTLIESELFGHERGAFTGAHESRAGHIEMAHTGTLFLDEIGTLGLGLQSKLLRVLEQHTVQRIGGKIPKKIDFRLITATNEELEEAVQAGRFREDLYYRINVVPISLPPLRERKEDIALLVDHFLHFYAGVNNLPAKSIDTDALEVLEDYSWPGNVRELENLIQRLVLMVSGPVIGIKHLPQQILSSSTAKQEALLIPEDGIAFDEEISRIEVAYLQAALRRSGGRKVAAAALLHINPQKMKYLCRKYGIRVNN
jgi:DNA-binding NtrC family response regulator